VSSSPRACPFCRIYVADPALARCETCDVALVPVRKLGPSPEERLAWEALPVEERPIPLSPTSHGRAPLVAASLVGILAYLLPWLEVRAADVWIMHGSDFGRKLHWPHAALAAWIVIVPTAITRRTLGRLLAARPVLATLASVPLLTLAVLHARPPTHRILHVESSWLLASWVEVAASCVALFAAVRLGRGTGAPDRAESAGDAGDAADEARRDAAPPAGARGP
jgi:hypothetical protein